MRKYYFMRQVLAWLDKSGNFSRLIAVTLRTAAVLVIPFSLVVFFKAGKVVFELPASEMLGAILFEVFYVIAIYCVVHALFIRAREIDLLPVQEFSMITLFSVVMKAAGESLAAFIALVSVGGGIYVWFTAKSISTVLSPLPWILPVFGGTNFMGGIQFMIGGVLTAIAGLGACYLVSELLLLLARHARRLGTAEPVPVAESVLAEEPVFRRRSGTSN